MGEEVPYGRRFTELAKERAGDRAILFAALDGTTRSVTWGELDAMANRLGRALAGRGVRVGDRVGIELRNSPELVATVIGAWKIGAAPVPMRWDLPDWERSRLVAVLDGRVVIGPDDPLSAEAASEADDPLPDVVPPTGWGICSSGSTGSPKIILVTRPGTFDPELARPFPAEWGPVEMPNRALIPAPLYHTNGFAGISQMMMGDDLVLLEKFDAARIVELVERERVTTFTATPTMLQRIARVPGVEQRDFSSIRWVLQGAAVIPPTLVRFWIDLLGAERFVMAYGMTEGLGLCALRGDQWLDHQGSVGRPIREAEVRVIGVSGEDLPPGEIGEIYLRSPTSGTFEYRGMASPLPTTPDGFATAGDLGWLDEDGYLYIADRRVDMIISGGANVFPAEVENALIDHPQIGDVVVIGLADEEWGRRVHAIVEPTDPADPPSGADVIAWAKQRLAAYKVPKTVEVLDHIPRSEATKVSRSQLVAERGG